MTGPEARVLRSFEELQPAQPPWTALQHHPLGDLGTFRNCLGREAAFVRPHVVLAGRDGEWEGLAAGCVRDERIAWRLGTQAIKRSRARVLRVAGNGLLGLGREPLARAVAGALMAALEAGEADVLYLHEVDPSAPLLAELERLAQGWQRDHGKRTVTGWVVDLPPTFEGWRRSLTAKARANLNQTRNRIQRELGARLVLTCYREPSDRDRLLEETEAIARRTYHRKAGVGFVTTEESLRFLDHALAQGWLRVHVLHDGARPIAFSHGLLYGRTFLGRQMGFDSEYARLRPGAHLLACIVEELCGQRAADRFDLGVQSNDLKRSLASRSYERVSTYVFARTLRGHRLALERAATGALDRAARRALGAARARRLVRGLTGMLHRDEDGKG